MGSSMQYISSIILPYLKAAQTLCASSSEVWDREKKNVVLIEV
jgi:hypothetical protein